MSLLNELVEGASGDEVEVATLLRKVKVLASRTRVTSLADWVDHELSGYPGGTALPEYRGPFHVGARGDFAGPFGSGYQNAPAPEAAILRHIDIPSLFNVELRAGISELNELSRSDSGGRMMWPTDVVAWINTLVQQGKLELYPMMGLQQAWCTIHAHTILGAIDAVRARVLDLALEFERLAPTAGPLCQPLVRRIAQAIH